MEETLYQLGMRQLGVISTVLSGKHRIVVRHYIKHYIAIGIERLYLHKTCTTHAPEELQVAYVTHYEEFGKIRSLEFVKKYLAGFLSVKDNALAGKFGKTAQSRFQYCILVNLQQKLHYVINITDFDYRLQC